MKTLLLILFITVLTACGKETGKPASPDVVSPNGAADTGNIADSGNSGNSGNEPDEETDDPQVTVLSFTLAQVFGICQAFQLPWDPTTTTIEFPINPTSTSKYVFAQSGVTIRNAAGVSVNAGTHHLGYGFCNVHIVNGVYNGVD